jgi:hypothetical protein
LHILTCLDFDPFSGIALRALEGLRFLAHISILEIAYNPLYPVVQPGDDLTPFLELLSTFQSLRHLDLRMTAPFNVTITRVVALSNIRTLELVIAQGLHGCTTSLYACFPLLVDLRLQRVVPVTPTIAAIPALSAVLVNLTLNLLAGTLDDIFYCVLETRMPLLESLHIISHMTAHIIRALHELRPRNMPALKEFTLHTGSHDPHLLQLCKLVSHRSLELLQTVNLLTTFEHDDADIGRAVRLCATHGVQLCLRRPQPAPRSPYAYD